MTDENAFFLNLDESVKLQVQLGDGVIKLEKYDKWFTFYCEY